MSHRLLAPRALTGVALLITSLGLGSTVAASAAPTPQAAALVARAFQDAAAAGSVHQDITNLAGSHRAVFSNDVGGDSGMESITVSGGIQARVLVTHQAAYVSGNTTALLKYFGFPRAAVSKISGRWVSISSTDAVYPAVADQATLSSVLSGLTPSGTLKELAPTTVNGQSVIGVQGALPKKFGFTGTMTVYLTRTGRPLPVKVSFVDGQAGSHASSTSVLSHWGERVAVPQPSRSIPIGRV